MKKERKLIVLRERREEITAKSGRKYMRKVVTVQCPTCSKIYDKQDFKSDTAQECSSCARKRVAKKKVYNGPFTIGEFNRGLYSKYKREAYKRKLKFNVSQQELWDLFLKQDRKCALSGVKISLKTKHRPTINGKSTYLDRSKITASLDRIDSNKDYTIDNVQWVHKVINIMKGNLSDNDFIFFCKKISNKNKDKDNTEPRLLNGGNYFKSKVQRLMGEDPTNKPDTSIPLP